MSGFGRGALYNNPYEIASLNLRELYPDGVLPNWTNPVLQKATRAPGTATPAPSDYRKTLVDPNQKMPGAQSRHRAGQGYAPDITGNPWGTTDPGYSQAGGPTGPGLPHLSHDAHPQNTADVRTQHGILAPTPVFGGGNRWLGSLAGLWHASPVAAIFFALTGLWIVNALILRRGSISRGTTRTGAATARVGTAAAGGAAATGTAGIDAVNTAVGSAVEAIDDLTPGA